MSANRELLNAAAATESFFFLPSSSCVALCHLTDDITTGLCHPVSYSPHKHGATMKSERKMNLGFAKGKFRHSLTDVHILTVQSWNSHSLYCLKVKSKIVCDMSSVIKLETVLGCLKEHDNNTDKNNLYI